MRFDELQGLRVVVWGAGREGRATFSELTRRGVDARIAITGSGDAPADLIEVSVTGDAAMRALLGADAVIKSPGIARTSPEFIELLTVGVRVTSLMDLWLNEFSERIIAVTGTKGKSTTATAITHILNVIGTSAELAGNVGIPVSGELDPRIEVAVAEVSSYQAADVTCSPRVAVLTSLYPEHLPWHGGYGRYVADKLNLVAHGARVVVLPSREHELFDLVSSLTGAETRVVTPGDLGIVLTVDELQWQGVGVISLDRLQLRGAHNLGNVALALTAVVTFLADVHGKMGLADRVAAFESLQTFAPLKYRLEQIPSADGKTWVDDSLATAPEAVVAALRTFITVPVTLIVGGAERDLSFAALTDYFVQRSKAEDLSPLVVIGTGPAGARLLAEAAMIADTTKAGDNLAARLQLLAAQGFQDALVQATEHTEVGGVVLLSPGAPSFDEFADYEARSAAFRSYIAEI